MPPSFQRPGQSAGTTNGRMEYHGRITNGGKHPRRGKALPYLEPVEIPGAALTREVKPAAASPQKLPDPNKTPGSSAGARVGHDTEASLQYHSTKAFSLLERAIFRLAA